MRDQFTKSPFRVFTIQVRLFSHFNLHLMETLDRIRYAVYHFEALAYDPVDRDCGKCGLQTNSGQSHEGYQSKRRYSH